MQKTKVKNTVQVPLNYNELAIILIWKQVSEECYPLGENEKKLIRKLNRYLEKCEQCYRRRTKNKINRGGKK